MTWRLKMVNLVFVTGSVLHVHDVRRGGAVGSQAYRGRDRAARR